MSADQIGQIRAATAGDDLFKKHKRQETAETESETYCSSSEVSSGSLSCTSDHDTSSDSDAIAGLVECNYRTSYLRRKRALHSFQNDDRNDSQRQPCPEKKRWDKRHSFGKKLAMSIVVTGTVSLLLSSIFLSWHSSFSPTNRKSPTDDEHIALLKREKKAIMAQVYAPRSSPSFTLILSTRHNRLDLIQNSVDSHAMCQRVKSIRVLWTLRDSPPPSVTDHKSGKVDWSGTGEERLLKDIMTEAVLVLSDDLIFSCHELDRAFSVWNQNPSRMVGFFPYCITSYPLANPFSKKSRYGLSVVSPSMATAYSIVTDRAAFVHRSFLIRQLFQTNDLPSFCRSVLLSLRVTSVTNESPIAVIAKPLVLRSSVLVLEKEKENHESDMKEVGACMEKIMANYGLAVQTLPEETHIFVGE